MKQPDSSQPRPDQPMSKRGHTRAILTLGLPLIGGHLGQIAIGATDAIMLGWYSVEALAAITLASMVFFTLFIFVSGFAQAVMPLVASFAAEEDEVGIRRATRMGLWLSLGCGALTLPVFLGVEPLLLLLGQGEQLSEDAAQYLQIAGLGIIPALVVMVLRSYLAALERTQVIFWITALSAVANALGNYAFIFGNWGAPELGLRGAAVASLITQMISVMAVIAYVIWVMPHHQLFVRFWRRDWAMLVRVFRLGLPIGLTILCETGLFAAAALMMGWLGTIPLAAHGIAVQLASITFMVHLGFCNVATIRVGNAFGRRDIPHMARGAHMVMLMSLVFSAITIVAFVVWPEPLISLFMREGETARAEILAIGVGLLAMAALFQLVDGAQAVALGMLRGVQDTKVPMIYAAISYWGIGIPCSYVLGFVLGWEGIGVWAGLVIGLGAAAVLLNLRFWGHTIKQLAASVA